MCPVSRTTQCSLGSLKMRSFSMHEHLDCRQSDLKIPIISKAEHVVRGIAPAFN